MFSLFSGPHIVKYCLAKQTIILGTMNLYAILSVLNYFVDLTINVQHKGVIILFIRS